MGVDRLEKIVQVVVGRRLFTYQSRRLKLILFETQATRNEVALPIGVESATDAVAVGDKG